MTAHVVLEKLWSDVPLDLTDVCFKSASSMLKLLPIIFPGAPGKVGHMPKATSSGSVCSMCSDFWIDEGADWNGRALGLLSKPRDFSLF